MDERQFLQKLNNSLNENKLNTELLNDENRFFRGKLLFKVINSICKLLKYFDFQNDIIIENKIPLIKIDNIKLIICNPYYLKHTKKKLSSSFVNSEKFLSSLKIKPLYIIDIGSCWGAC